MKLCIVTNYIDKGYVNEILILNKLISTLNLLPEDVYSTSEVNSSYSINKKYTHALVLLDFKMSNIELILPFIENILVPKVFVIDTVPSEHKKLDLEILKSLNSQSSNTFSSLTNNTQNLLYEKYADAFVFYSDLDLNIFNSSYQFTSPKPVIILPPSLGEKKDINLNLSNFKPNFNIGFNGVPSFNNGLHNISHALNHNNQYYLNVYGKHGRSPHITQSLINSSTSNNPNINFRGQLKNYNLFYQTHHIYSNVGIYESFDLPTLNSMINGVVPIISPTLPISEYLPNYPFKIDPININILEILDQIKNTPDSDLIDILNESIESLKILNNKDIKESYFHFLNKL